MMNKSISVCFVVSGDLWGGAEAQVYQLARCMLDNDYQVFVITLNKGILFKMFCDMPLVVTSFDESKVSAWSTIFKIRSFLKKNKIDLVHSHGFKENLLAGIASRMLMRCKVIRTHHGRGVVNGRLTKVLVEKLNAYLLTDKIIAVSHDLKRYLTEFGFSAKKIDVVHNGIDCKKLSASISAEELAEMHSIPDGSFIIGTASRIEHEKGFEYLLLAVKELVDSGMPVVFVIVGSGNLQQKYLAMAKEMDIASSVIFTGFQKDVCSYLNLFDLFVMMSLNEGVPLALLEAMCMAKPVVSSAVGGIPEVVISDICGILVPTMDYHACAAACKKIIRQKELRDSLGENARKHVIENFSAQKSAENTINLYRGILAS